MLSHTLNRYYEPLRLPIRPVPTSASALYETVGTPPAPPHRVSSTWPLICRHMPPLLPRKIPRTLSVFPARRQRPSPYVHWVGILNFINEATYRFTYVTACGFANWELTTPCCQDAAPLSYRGVRTIPRAGLEPARLAAVTANGRS